MEYKYTVVRSPYPKSLPGDRHARPQRGRSCRIANRLADGSVIVFCSPRPHASRGAEAAKAYERGRSLTLPFRVLSPHPSPRRGKRGVKGEKGYRQNAGGFCNRATVHICTSAKLQHAAEIFLAGSYCSRAHCAVVHNGRTDHLGLCNCAHLHRCQIATHDRGFPRCQPFCLQSLCSCAQWQYRKDAHTHNCNFDQQRRPR